MLSIDELRLRPWQVDDADVWVQAYQNPAIERWHVRTLDHDEAVQYLESLAGLWQSEDKADWAVTDSAGDVLGRIGLNGIDLYEGAASFAYWTLPPARGRQVAPRAVQAVTDWAFSLGFHRLSLRHSVLNEASCRVAEKAGYAYEATNRLDGRHADGWHDMHLHARLNPAQV